jgi:hypothetical protein
MMKVASSILLLQLAAVAVAYSPLSPVQQARASLITSPGETSRRNLLASVALGTSALLIDPSKAFAAASTDEGTSNLVDFKDAVRKVSIKVPSDWDKTIQELPDRRQITLYIKPNSDQKTLMFFAYTPVRDDFTSLGSFGNVDQVSCWFRVRFICGVAGAGRVSQSIHRRYENGSNILILSIRTVGRTNDHSAQRRNWGGSRRCR